MREKIIVIVGPTAAGKTALAIALAKKYQGEIINADSRQIYRELDIGTAKPAGRWQEKKGVQAYWVDGVAHHLMDFVSPDEEFSLANWQDLAEQKIREISTRGQLPILVGGTGLYVSAITDGLDIPRVPADKKLRAELGKLSVVELAARLKKVDPESWEIIDRNNPRRLIRALEVAEITGQSFAGQQKRSGGKFDVRILGVTAPRAELYARINARVDAQMKGGLLREVKKLAKKYDWRLPGMSSIGYRQLGYYLRGEMNLDAAVELIKRDTRRYAKRQMTWFQRDARIKWVEDWAAAEEKIKKWLYFF